MKIGNRLDDGLRVAGQMAKGLSIATVSTLLILFGSSFAMQTGDVVVTPEIRAIVNAPDRSEDDRVTDGRRHPAKMLTFFGVQPGMNVLDIGAGRGYTSELLARAVSPGGSVVAQTDSTISERFMKGETPARYSKDVMKNVTYVVRPYGDPVPPGTRNLDLITLIFVYHDMEWLGVDRAAANRSLFKALKPGGHVVVVDHAGNPGTGVSESKTTHRIEESVVHQEFSAAGFQLVDVATFLRNPDDPRTESFRQATIPSDRFVLKFRKP